MHWAANKVWQSMACALRDADGHRRYDALHRPAACGHSGGDRRTGSVGHRPARGSTPSSCSCWAASGLFRRYRQCCLQADTRWFDSWALLIGWAAGMVTGTAMAYAAHLTPIYPLTIGGFSMPVHGVLHAPPQFGRGSDTYAGAQITIFDTFC